MRAPACPICDRAITVDPLRDHYTAGSGTASTRIVFRDCGHAVSHAQSRPLDAIQFRAEAMYQAWRWRHTLDWLAAHGD